MMPLVVGAVYEHVKTGGKYRLIALAKDANTLEEIVVYESLYENKVSKVWVRTRENFLGEAQSPEGIMHPRFKLIEGA